MDDVLKTLIDDYTEMEYRYGKAMAQINAIINLMGAVGGLFALAMITVIIGNKKDPSFCSGLGF